MLANTNAPLTKSHRRCNNGCKRRYPFPVLGATLLAPAVSGSPPSGAGCGIPSTKVGPTFRSRIELASGVGSQCVREPESLEIAWESRNALTPIEECRR